MSPEEAMGALELLTGLWPSPKLTQEEGRAVIELLGSYSGDDLRTAISDLTSQGRAFRPSPAEVLCALRAVRRRQGDLAWSRALPLPAKSVDPRPYLQEARAALAAAARREAARREAQEEEVTGAAV